MPSAISRFSYWSLTQLEASLLPVKGSVVKKVACYACQLFKFSIFLPLSVGSSLLSFGVDRFCVRRQKEASLIEFAKHPTWRQQGTSAAPVDIGFSTADFQDNGPKVHPNTNWGKFYADKGKDLGPLEQLPDLWNHPERVIERLHDLGVKKFRFSISRDKIEPSLGRFDEVALQHYRSFCEMLQKNGIEPMVTLHHFTDPTYFSWERKEDVDGFVRYAETVSEMLYKAGVRKIITINEPTVIAFQGWVMGEFPPHRKIDFEGAGRVIENMMRAHVRVYEALKKRHGDFEIGLSHDPIRFRHFHKANPLWTPIEKIVCHYLTEINHTAFMRFLQTGEFALKVPFRADYHFSLGHRPPIDFIGLQYYTDPLIKISWTTGESVTREPKEKVSSYQYRTYPQGLASILEELKSLKVPIDLTEIGIDTGINHDSSDEDRIRYYDRVFQVVQRAKEEGANVRSLYFWTLIDNLEWYKAFAVRFGFYSFDPKSGRIEPRPASHWLKERIAARNRLAAAQ